MKFLKDSIPIIALVVIYAAVWLIGVHFDYVL